ncbi:CYTH domain protein [Gimesia panareensis]|uniref:CYTH domain protein n=1 Tax=Gimesia panareensis TaxID=2527978 RepID=A0A518FNI0_9PLAN|nr:class IV adenylate cyclase [Gimesia panareensis]QDV17913.1 CYTH domain protein [Gimesia panareensis]
MFNPCGAALFNTSQSPMLEIEQKFQISDKSHLLAQLEQIGATQGATLDQEDYYFAHPSRDFVETDEALRIRRIGTENHITYKGPKRATVSKIRKEIELAFEAGPAALSQLKEMLELLGFQPVRNVKKQRTPYSFQHDQRHFEITIDEVEELGTFAEVETLAEEAELEQAEAAVIQLAGQLGLSSSIRTSYLGMLMQQEESHGAD